MYIVSILNGKSKKEAYRIAYYAQYTDQDKKYNAIDAGIGLYWPRTPSVPDSSPYYNRAVEIYQSDTRYLFDIQNLLHSLHGGKYKDILNRRECLQKLLQDQSLEDWERGFVAHALGDAFAHTEGDGPDATAYGGDYPFGPLGHFFDGSTPDVPSGRPELFRNYLGVLNQGLGGKMNAGQLAAMTRLLTRKFESDKDRFNAAREMAQGLGYSESFDPSVSESLDRNLPMIDRNAVEKLFGKIEQACCKP